MQKFNQLGLELLSTKDELLNPNHSEIIRKALLFQAESMTENKLIDPDTHLALTNNDLPSNDFELFLNEKKLFMKTADELRHEYDVIREAIAEQLPDTVVFDSLSKVENESILFIQTFELDVDWVKSYFSVKDAEIPQLMKEKGFIARFAVLRIPKLVDEFLATRLTPNPIVSVYRSEHLFRNAETSSYCMDLMYSLPIEQAEEATKHKEITQYLAETARASAEFFTQKVS